MKDEEKTETPADEAKESPAKEKKEQETGTEGVKLPEEFQKQVYDLVKMCDSKEKCSYMHTCLYSKEEELRKAESKGKKGSKPAEFSTASEPSY